MIPLFAVNVHPDAGEATLRTLYSGYLTEGPRVREFERALGPWVGTERVVAVNSGTSAITLALKLAGVGPGTAVITTPMTCTATNLPILTLGATPVFADVDSWSGLIDPRDVKWLLERSHWDDGFGKLPVKAVVCVDWGGAPCDLPGLLRLCREHGVRLVEDAAHALGAVCQGEVVGSAADVTCFSFQAIKHLTTGDGGAMTFRNGYEWDEWGERAYRRAKLLRWFGIDREVEVGDSRIEVDIAEPGFKFHMNDLAAAIGLANLSNLEYVLNRHRDVAQRYDDELPYHYYSRQRRARGSSWWLYTVLLPSRDERDGFIRYMGNVGVQVSRVHRRNDEYAVFAPFRRRLSGLDYFSDRMVCLPCHAKLTWDEQSRVIGACRAWEEMA